MFWKTHRKLKELESITREIRADLADIRLSSRNLEKHVFSEKEPEKNVSPLVTLILGGIGTALLAVGNNFFQWYSNHTLEQGKLRSTLILKAVDAATAEERKQALVFLVEAGLISDPHGKITKLPLKEVPRVESLSTITSEAEPFPLRGKLQTFGGPNDTGFAPSEDLALVEKADLDSAEFKDYFLTVQPPGTTGLGRRLDPEKYYVACRWDYSHTPRSLLRRLLVKVTNPKNGKSALAKPVDWGPAAWTGRKADISPGLARFLGVQTDDEVEISLDAKTEKLP